MAVVETVFRLDRIDTELQEREAALAELQRRQRRHPDLEAARSRLAQLETEEQRAAAESRRAESDLADIEVKARRAHGLLYGGTVVDPRELASLERQLEHAREEQRHVEERFLETMEALEQATAGVAEARARVARLERAWEEARPGMTEQAQALAAAIRDLRVSREPLSDSLDPRTRDVYERLRAGIGHAVSPVSNGVCGWCRVTIPQKDIQHARGGAVVHCPNCRRILHVAR